MVRQSATVFEEKSKVIQQTEFAGDQFILTLEAQKSSITALPGEFAFVDCGENIMLRRPLSYLRANKKQKTSGTYLQLKHVSLYGIFLLTCGFINMTYFEGVS